MSRIGKQLIEIPDKVDVQVNNGFVIVNGPKGELKQELRPEIKIEIQDKHIEVAVAKNTKESSAFWGLYRTLIFNMIQGVLNGYEKNLEIHGVGYRAEAGNKKITLHVGFSHPVEFEAPDGIELKIEKNIITVSGIDKQLVGQVAAKIRSIRKPEPYKGKGIRYKGEYVKIKPGKKAVGTETGAGAAA